MAKRVLLVAGGAAAVLPAAGLIFLRPFLPEYLALHAIPIAGLLVFFGLAAWLLLVFGLAGLWFHRGYGVLSMVAHLYWLTAFFGLARVPWKYPYDFESYLLNVFLFPLFIIGLYVTVGALFNKSWAYKITLPVFLLFAFPAKALVKIVFDQPSPWGVVSPILGLLVLAGGYWLAAKTVDKNPY